jgi:ABC-type multidrug transport system fused ATPase/permease subunit
LVLSLWSNHTSSVQQQQQQQQAAATPSAPAPSYNTGYYLALYFVLGLGSVGVVLARSALLVFGSIAASRRLHRQLLHKLLRLPMSFFDAQPSGEA